MLSENDLLALLCVKCYLHSLIVRELGDLFVIINCASKLIFFWWKWKMALLLQCFYFLFICFLNYLLMLDFLGAIKVSYAELIKHFSIS